MGVKETDYEPPQPRLVAVGKQSALRIPSELVLPMINREKSLGMEF
jgi:hypothetical protein